MAEGYQRGPRRLALPCSESTSEIIGLKEGPRMSCIDDSFTLYDLRVEVIATNKPMVCNHREGDYFELSGEGLSLPDGQTFPMYPLAAILPLLPAKQRETHGND